MLNYKTIELKKGWKTKSANFVVVEKETNIYWN